jgi:hypothetical protein
MTMIHNARVLNLDAGKRVLLYGDGEEGPKRLEITDYTSGSRSGHPPVVCLWGDDLAALARLLAKEVL